LSLEKREKEGRRAGGKAKRPGQTGLRLVMIGNRAGEGDTFTLSLEGGETLRAAHRSEITTHRIGKKHASVVETGRYGSRSNCVVKRREKKDWPGEERGGA